jgi:hypothetical protein
MVNLLSSQLLGNVKLNLTEGTEFAVSFPLNTAKNK